MKKIFFLLIFCLSISLSQTQIFTQDASNKYKNYTAATTGDTLITRAAKPSGSSIRHQLLGSYLVGISINTAVTSDTVIIKNGTGVVATIILGTVTNSLPMYVPMPTNLDTSLIVVKKKTSDITVFYQTRR